MPLLAEKVTSKKVGKLAPYCKDKRTCVVHIKNLDQAFINGLKSKNLHRFIKFERSYWRKSYVMLNTKLKTAAENEKKRKTFYGS